MDRANALEAQGRDVQSAFAWALVGTASMVAASIFGLPAEMKIWLEISEAAIDAMAQKSSQINRRLSGRN